MKPLAAFYDALLPELPGCGTAMLDQQLRQTAREFCTATGAWRLSFDDITLLPGVVTYDLDPPEPLSEVVRLYSLSLDGRLMWRDSDRDTGNQADDCPRYPRNEPPFTLSPDLTEITLLPWDGEGLALQLVGAMKPTANAAALPDFLLSQYTDALRYGVLSRLMLMAKKPWTDRALASVYDGRWNQALNFAAYQVQTGNTRAALRVKSWG